MASTKCSKLSTGKQTNGKVYLQADKQDMTHAVTSNSSAAGAAPVEVLAMAMAGRKITRNHAL